MIMARYLCLSALLLWGTSALAADSELPGEIAMEVFFGEQKKTSQEKPQENNPSGRGCFARNNIFATGDFIYWKAVEDEVVLVQRSPNFVTAGNTGLVQSRNLHFSYAPGFELGVGANMNYGDWDVYGNWSSLRNNHNTIRRSGTTNEYIVVPLAINNSSPPVASSYNIRWKLNYDTFDFELGRAYYLSKRVILRPYVGARAVWIFRSIESNFSGLLPYRNFFNGNVADLTGPIFFKSSNAFWGLGPRIGINSRWLLGHTGFGLMANLSGSFEAGAFKNRSIANVNDPAAGMISGVLQVKRLFTTRANFDAAVGVDFGKCFNEWLYLYLSLGYDVSYWWNMLSLVSYLDPSGIKTDLSLRGLDFKIRLDF